MSSNSGNDKFFSELGQKSRSLDVPPTFYEVAGALRELVASLGTLTEDNPAWQSYRAAVYILARVAAHIKPSP